MPTDIVSTSTITTLLGGGFDSADTALLNAIRLRVESFVRQYCRWNITEANYTHFLPATGPVGNRLILPQPFVTDVASVYEDYNAKAGQQSGDFAAGTLLTVGDDYYLDYDAEDDSKEGIIVRVNKDWPSRPRTVKVTYTSGLDSDALAGDYAFVVDAVIGETIARYKYTKDQQGTTGSVGPLIGERLKDYSAQFWATPQQQSSVVGGMSPTGLLPVTALMLNPIVQYGTWFS